MVKRKKLKVFLTLKQYSSIRKTEENICYKENSDWSSEFDNDSQVKSSKSKKYKPLE